MRASAQTNADNGTIAADELRRDHFGAVDFDPSKNDTRSLH
jgi:hypothetical protein